MAENAPSPSSTSPAPPTQAAPSSNLRGIIAMVAAVGFFSLMDALLKTLTAHYPAMQVAALRGWAALPLVALYALWRGEVPRLLKVRWPLHLLRGGLNVAMLALFAFAIRELALAEAYTLFFIAPLLAGTREIGVLYADSRLSGRALKHEQFVAFQRFTQLTGRCLEALGKR